MATRKKEGEYVERLRLEERHLRMVDDFIEEQQRQGLFGMASPSSGKEPTDKGLAIQRRRVIGELIEKHLNFDVRHPVKVKIIFPSFLIGTADEIERQADETVKWAKAEEKRLNESAPEAVQDSFGYNKLARLKRSDPAKFRRVLAETLKRDY